MWHSRRSHFTPRLALLLSRMCSLSFRPPIPYISLSKTFFSRHYACLLSLQLYFLLIHIVLSRETNEYSFKYLLVLDHLGADGRADIGCRVYSNTNTSPCASSHRHRTKRRLRCVSLPRPMSSRASSCSFVESAQTMLTFGRRRPLVRLRRTGRPSGRRSSASMRCARPITRCSACWSGAGWRLNELGKDNGDLFYSSFLLVYVLVMGTCVQGWCCYISETATSLQHFHLGLLQQRYSNFGR